MNMTFYRKLPIPMEIKEEFPLTEELAQRRDACIEDMKKIFRGESDIKTWMFSIARHKWIDYLRKKNRQVKTEVLTELIGESQTLGADNQKSTEDRYLDKELLERLEELLLQEPERTRKIVKLRMEGYSFYEIGKCQNISESSARVIYFRAKEKLRQNLEKEGLGYE